MDELKDIYGSKDMNRVKKVHESKDAGFIDIHCHVLPMVDDGAESMEMALDMLRIAADEGIRKMILTPHQKADRKCVTPEGIAKRTELLQKKAEELKIPVKLFPGNEIFYRH
ncbi:CpsB/CapC family capsule biosynthesis tyrosine phosphatase, partial [Eisenbergiella porci]|uniref:CpsB/CapC family capsule biosynthesis tyrosine phosphatase n=1 Tax=Eisenbergiella porci TaxID=2652274 RepID=UPI002A8173C2